MEDNRFYGDKDKPELTMSYCAFLDILGFTKKIQDSFKNGTHDYVFDQFYRSVVKKIESIRKEHEDNYFIHIKTFTDNIVLGTPIYQSDGESEWGFMLPAIIDYQLSMALDGFFVRGGLAEGFLYMDESTVYGEALLDAYELENKKSVYPRIILSQKLKETVISHMMTYTNARSAPQNHEVLIDSDGNFFINYLWGLMDYPYPYLWSNLERHKEQIINAIEDNKNNPKVFEKYYWLVVYHNHFCDQIRKADGYNKKYKIPSLKRFKALGSYHSMTQKIYKMKCFTGLL